MTRPHRLSWPKATAGFTLIELLVVILVIGVLLAVALPSFLGQQAKAQDSATKQYLTVAWKAEEAEAAGGQQVNGAAIVSAINASEPQLDAFAAPVTQCVDYAAYSDNRQICVVDTASDADVAIYAKSDSGTLFCLTEAPANTPAIERIASASDICDGGYGAGDDNADPSAPENTALPTIEGPPQEGETLTADPGQWTGTPALEYQWQYDEGNDSTWLDIPGASSQTYTPSALVVGWPVRIQVTATEGDFETPAYSVPTGSIWSAPVAPPARPLTLTLLNGLGENSTWINPANMGNLVFRVGLPTSSRPGDTVHLQALYSGNSTVVTTQSIGGGGNVNLSIDVSSFPNAPISFIAWVSNVYGSSDTRNAAHTKDTVAPDMVAVQLLSYTDNVGSTPDTVGVNSGQYGFGWMNTVYAVQLSPGSSTHSVYVSDYFGNATLTLAPATTTVTYRLYQSDRAGNLGPELEYEFSATQ